MAIGKAETTIVLSLLGVAIAGGIYATASFARLPRQPEQGAASAKPSEVTSGKQRIPDLARSASSKQIRLVALWQF